MPVITAVSYTTPIVVTAPAHGLVDSPNIMVNITNVTTNTAANGTWYYLVIDADNFSLTDSESGDEPTVITFSAEDFSTHYGTLAEGDDYFGNRLRSRYWTEATTEDRQKALSEATSIIDKLNYAGQKADSAQTRQFPRATPSATCPTEVVSSVDTAVPADVEIACYEIAMQLLSGVDPDLEIESLAAHSQGFSTARTTYERAYVLEHIAAGVPSAKAWQLLKPFMRDPRRVDLSRVN